ncbi:MAG: homogentisate phytyltransferase [Bacteroidia bacterium]|nr:homogentisate phytyltransferase [Bacteroidia bacterium]
MRIKTLIQFSRPHTIIGTIVSITTLYAMVCNGNESEHIGLLIKAIITGLMCNIFIVGINQIEDIELDKINKPYLPLASGALTKPQAKSIVWACFWGALMMSILIHPILIGVVGLSMGIGWAYSCPPLYLRKHHLPAALSISIVRGLMVNFGGYYVFNSLINHSNKLSNDIVILCIFITLFSVVIAWFKDLPDMQGDRQYQIKTMALLYTPKGAILAGHILLIPAYLFTIYEYRESIWLGLGHVFLLIAFLSNTIALFKLKVQSYKQYYKRFWYLFFAEYILYLIAFI